MSYRTWLCCRRDTARCVPTIINLILLFLFVIPTYAQDTTVTDDDVNAIAKGMYCPVCENIPLDVCPTAACAQWRGEIRTQLEAGRTPEQIIQDFVQRFGERVIGTPQDPTLRALSLATPWLIGIAALVVAGLTLARWRSGRDTGVQWVASGTPAPTSELLSDEDYRARLERDLAARR
jgi:cytochrome c-type biogenesis protein CcmH